MLTARPPATGPPNPVLLLFGAGPPRHEWMAIGRPRLIVAVGSVARAALTPAERRVPPGTWVELPDHKTYVWVHYHPAWGLRQGRKARQTMELHWEVMGEWIQENELL